MHRNEEDGNAANLYTEGDPSLSIPATVVGAANMNSFQEEIAAVIESAGIALLTKDTDTYDQLIAALKVLIQTGGEIAPIEQTLANNSADQDVLSGGNPIEFDRTVVKGISYQYHIRRNTDSNAVVEQGILSVAYEPKNQVWKISTSSDFDDAGVQLKLAAGSNADRMKLQYTTNDLAGTSYFGELSLTNYKETRV